ncbi:rhomboid-like protein [Streptomyces sp. NPDC048664]|uniref:rhomboid-like protein n=1 Tax=Streptomyces sp. NPDC048664 TaxID=3154505 RepID=UPI003449D747
MNPPSPRGLLGGLLRAVRAYPRRAPLTLAYVCVLLACHAWINYGLSAGRAAELLGRVSTNLDNLHAHPVAALLGSVLFFDGTLTDVASVEFAGTLITLGLGVCCFLALAERRWGKRPAVALFLGGHVAATLLTALVIAVALRHGWYPAAVRHDVDFGISYGAQTVMAAGTLALPRRGRLPWALFVLAWPLGGAEWPGPLPDFTTIGHLIAAALGFGVAAVALTRRRNRTDRPTVPDAAGRRATSRPPRRPVGVLTASDENPSTSGPKTTAPEPTPPTAEA